MKYQVLRQYKDLITLVVNFYTSKATDPAYFEEIKNSCKDDTLLKLIHNHEIYLNQGYLTRDDFLTYATSKKLVDGVPIQPFDLILEALTENLLLLKMEPNTINNTHKLYIVNDALSQFYYSNGLLFNKLFGFDYIIERYLPSVFKIEHFKNGDVSIGNGFLLNFEGNYVILTNRHVVENADKIIVKSEKEEIVEFEKIIEDNKNDLAFILPKNKIDNAESFVLNTNLKVLEDILTIGYPPIPTTQAAYPLFHLGEINSFVKNYWGDSLFIFSAKTNPGNSGSPIIDKMGTILGIVTQQLEEQEWYKQSKIPYYAAIPSHEINRFWFEKSKAIKE